MLIKKETYMQNQQLLPDSKYIDTNAGLKYLNNNRELYLKILNRFLTRYREFDIKNIKEDNFKNEMHTLKGLSSTLGMEHLTDLTKKLYDEQNEELLNDFTETLNSIITTINSMHPKTILILTEKHNEIDAIVEILDDSYDIMVTITMEEAIESIDNEHIDIVLLHPIFKTHQIESILKQKKIYMIEIFQPFNKNSLKSTIEEI